MQSGALTSAKGQKTREQRRVVFLRAQLHTERGSFEGTICNIALHGLMVKCAEPPARGTFVEVRCDGVIVVGRVVWSNGARFGLRSQDKINLAALQSSRPGRSRTQPAAERIKPPRYVPAPAPQSFADLEEQSRNAARLFDWVSIALVAVAAAFFLATSIYSVFEAPLARSEAALRSSNR